MGLSIEPNANPLPVTKETAAGSAVTVRDESIARLETFTVSTSFARPADTTQYAVGDACTVHTTPVPMEFADTGGADTVSVIVDKVVITSSVLGSVLATANFRLHLFSATVTATADNSAFALTDANNNLDSCSVLVPTSTSTESSTANNQKLEASNLGEYITLASTSIFGLLELTNAYTPANGETFTVTLKGFRN